MNIKKFLFPENSNKTTIIVLFALLTVALFNTASAAEDGYLSELEAEATNSGKVQNETAPIPKKEKSQQDRFERLLKFERPSTYHFYTKLNIGEKKKVITSFRKEKKLSVASKKIFDLYFEHKK